MSTPQMVPMVAPDGTVGMIPADRVNEALGHGGKLGVRMQSPTGQTGIIPRENVVTAVRNGGKVLQDSASVPTQFENRGGVDPNQRFADPVSEKGLLGKAANWGRATAANLTAPILHPAETVEGMGKGSMAAGMTPYGAPMYAPTGNQQRDEANTQAFQQNQNEVVQGAAQEMKDHPNYVVGGLVGPALLTGGIAKTRFPGVVADVVSKAPEALAKTAEVVRGKASDFVKTSPKQALFPGKQGNVMEAAAKLPPKAVTGSEQLFQAAAPTNMNKGYRAAQYTAAGDLAEIARKNDLSSATGGMVNPDMRVRQTVSAITDHMQQMYQEEVAPQFAKVPNAQVSPKFGVDAKAGLEYIAENAGTEATRNLAAKAASGQQLTLTEAYDLARATNKYLLGYESMTSAEKSAAGITGRKLAGLKPVDGALSETINQTLKGLGEPGILNFEKRYAALANIRSQLESRMNATELQRTNPLKVVGKVISPLTGGKAGIVSASQAAIADVNVGRMIEKGFKNLADSGIKAERDVAVRPNIKGLLPRGAIQLGQGEAIPTGTVPGAPILERPYNPTGATTQGPVEWYKQKPTAKKPRGQRL